MNRTKGGSAYDSFADAREAMTEERTDPTVTFHIRITLPMSDIPDLDTEEYLESLRTYAEVIFDKVEVK